MQFLMEFRSPTRSPTKARRRRLSLQHRSMLLLLTFLAYMVWSHLTREWGSGNPMVWLKREKIPRGSDDSYLALCIPVRAEHCDIREWVLHHASIGVGKFYVYDTKSAARMEGVLQDLIATGLVQYHFVRQADLNMSAGSEAWLPAVHQRCLQQYGSRHEWMGFIDADEFIILDKHVESLPHLLELFKDYAGLLVHWRVFAPSGHAARPSGGVLSSYTKCCSKDHYVKPIVQPRLVKGYFSPHNWEYEGDYYAVNTEHRRINGSFLEGAQPSYTWLSLHHYVTKSAQDFERKMKRRDGVGRHKDREFFDSIVTRCKEECTAAVEWGRELEQKFDLARHTPRRCREPYQILQ